MEIQISGRKGEDFAPSLFEMGKHTDKFEHLVSDLLLELFDAGLEGNQRRLELLALHAIRNLKAHSPDLSSRLAEVPASLFTDSNTFW